MAGERGYSKKTAFPKGLSKQAGDLWTSITSAFVIEAHDRAILEAALFAFDRMVEARELVDRDGIIVTAPNGYQQRHPALQVEKDATARFLAAWRVLGLDMEPPKEIGRPPGR